MEILGIISLIALYKFLDSSSKKSDTIEIINMERKEINQENMLM